MINIPKSKEKTHIKWEWQSKVLRIVMSRDQDKKMLPAMEATFEHSLEINAQRVTFAYYDVCVPSTLRAVVIR